MQPLTQGSAATSGCVMETIYIPHVESGQHEVVYNMVESTNSFKFSQYGKQDKQSTQPPVNSRK